MITIQTSGCNLNEALERQIYVFTSYIPWTSLLGLQEFLIAFEMSKYVKCGFCIAINPAIPATIGEA